MALRALMKRKELNELKTKLSDLKAVDFAKREEEIKAMIEEAETDEERTAVEEEIEKFEAERAEKEREINEIEESIAEIEAELDEIEKKAEEPGQDPKPAERNEVITMNKRNIFYSMDVQTRTAMFEREDVKAFLANVRTAMQEKRAISGAELTIPEVFLGLIRENILEYSKLYKHVNVRQIGGNGRQVVMGTIPEGVWTDCCGTLNELSFSFYGVEINCWKVGGYVDVCNATLQDSDVDLASEVLITIGQAIGLALDKAIIFGLGTRMPLGFFTRLAQTTEPGDYPADARPWADLHTSNIKSIASSVTGIDLFRTFMVDTAAAKGVYSRGEKVWVMNEATYTALVAAAMDVDAGGAIVSGVNGVMPVIGGVIEVLPFIPDNMIFGGYMDLYLLAEREGTTLAQSEHVRFIEDRTVFKGTARYDGKPSIAEGFVAIGINGVTPSAATITFAPDTANASE